MPDRRRRDPVGELAGLGDASHQRRDEGAVLRRGSHSRSLASHSASLTTRPSGDTAMPANVPICRLNALCGTVRRNAMPAFSMHLVPAADAGHRVLDVVVAQHLVQRVEHRHFALDELAVLHVEHACSVWPLQHDDRRRASPLRSGPSGPSCRRWRHSTNGPRRTGRSSPSSGSSGSAGWSADRSRRPRALRRVVGLQLVHHLRTCAGSRATRRIRRRTCGALLRSA